MAGWHMHSGKVVSLPVANIDTDQLIPARFMSAPRSEGYGQFLLYDMRRGPDGALSDDFPINRHKDASILLARENFGSGSSREAAVYTLVDAGFRAVIAPSFGDIFASNAVNNGLLPARVAASDCASLETELATQNALMNIDLFNGQLSLGALRVDFVLDESWRTKLINGWDDIDLTRQHDDLISAFASERRRTAPWTWPREADRIAPDLTAYRNDPRGRTTGAPPLTTVEKDQ